MNLQRDNRRRRQRRSYRTRNQIRAGTVRPRLSVFRSHKHIYAQVVDDEGGKTIAAASTVEKQLSDLPRGGNKTAAEEVGKLIAQRAKEAGIVQVALDRGSCKYHGRVAALADAARKGGLDF